MHTIDTSDSRHPVARHGRRLALGGLTFVAAMALAACSGSAASDAPAGSAGGGDVCADATELRTAVDDLKDIELTSVGTDGLKAAVDDVRSAGTALKSSAAANLEPKVSALETALDGLRTAVDQIGDGEVGAAAADIKTAVAAVDTAATGLVTDVQAGC